MDKIEKRVGNMIYIIKGLKFTLKKHLNIIRKRMSDDADTGPPEEKEVMDVIYNTFDIPISQVALEQRRLKRKRKMMDFIVINPKRKKFWDSCGVNTLKVLSWSFTHAYINSHIYE